MASDYIYIFCIPGSGSSGTSAPTFSAPAAESSLENNRASSSAVFSRSSANSAPSNNNNISVSSSGGSTPALGRNRPVNRPQPSVMDVPDDWAPLPARQQNRQLSSYRASFPGTTGSVWAQESGQRSGGASRHSSFLDNRFAGETCALPSYMTPQNTSSQSAQDVRLPPFYTVRWSPRATSSPVRESRRGLCDARAKDCWRRVFNRACCMRCFVTVTTFRWLLLFFASVGAGCILSGVVLGVLYISLGTSFLVLSVMFMGLGLMLLVVIIVGWRCTPAGHEPCHLLFNFEQWFDVSRSQRVGQTVRRRDRALDQNQWFGGVIYPEFRGRTPPPTYSASMMDYEDRPRTVSCEDVEMFPNTSTSVDVEPVPATPPPAYRGHCGRSSARRSMPVYCPRALRSRPVSFVANDSTRPATSGSASAVVARANSSSEFDVGKWLPGIERGMVPTGSLKPEASDSQAVSISYPDDDRCLATSSSHETHES